MKKFFESKENQLSVALSLALLTQINSAGEAYRMFNTFGKNSYYLDYFFSLVFAVSVESMTYMAVKYGKGKWAIATAFASFLISGVHSGTPEWTFHYAGNMFINAIVPAAIVFYSKLAEDEEAKKIAKIVEASETRREKAKAKRQAVKLAKSGNQTAAKTTKSRKVVAYANA